MGELRKQQFVESECQRKIKYPDRTVAHRSLRALIRVYGNPNLHYYYCRVCGNYHIGNRGQF